MDPQPLPEPQHVKPSDTSKNLVTGREYGKPNPPWPQQLKCYKVSKRTLIYLFITFAIAAVVSVIIFVVWRPLDHPFVLQPDVMQREPNHPYLHQRLRR